MEIEHDDLFVQEEGPYSKLQQLQVYQIAKLYCESLRDGGRDKVECIYFEGFMLEQRIMKYTNFIRIFSE